ncbi:gephyrin-like molybdotransferase Glp [Thermomonas sp.]|uniref:molybdopterin molybdotransferase MoeA n=1 Tax=Thermomonas sp. TaxID=1971895 RepID=UPI00248A2C8F|nr:gephyrin-like molybdotransferase Glp [Thermomonas sp.]MDI1252143.1 molybdopterin molybdotransferase MoeA [Thermomonas sp.]
MISYASALQHILQACQPLPPVQLPLAQALGRVLAQDVRADADLPPFDNSAMDGFALASAGTTLVAGHEFAVAGSQAAGDGLAAYSGEACEIMTGASLPDGLDCVVPVEQVSVLQRDKDGCPLQIRLDAEVSPGAHVRRRGQDVAVGDPIASAGIRLTPALHMLLSSLGVATLMVRPQVPAALFTTGRELVDDPSQPLLPGQIRNSNGPYLADRLDEAGARVVHRETVGDDAQAFIAALERGLAAGARVVLSTGAVSMGRHDFVPDALRSLHATILFHKVAIRPGKPLLFARLPGGQLYFGLPGNPVSSAVGMRFFVEPALRALLGQAPEQPLLLPLAAESRKKPGLRFFLKAYVALGDGARLQVEVMSGQESFRIKPLLAANAWVVLDADADMLPAGTLVPVFGLDGRGILLTNGEDTVGHRP